jgi:hypothetical protein
MPAAARSAILRMVWLLDRYRVRGREGDPMRNRRSLALTSLVLGLALLDPRVRPS